QLRGAGQDLAQHYHFARHNSPTTSRLVLDLAGPAAVAGQFLLRPDAQSPHYRLVLDLAPTSQAQFAASEGMIAAPFAPEAPAVAMGGPQYVLAAAETTPEARITSVAEPASAAFQRRTIVIDPGHG